MYWLNRPTFPVIVCSGVGAGAATGGASAGAASAACDIAGASVIASAPATTVLLNMVPLSWLGGRLRSAAFQHGPCQIKWTIPSIIYGIVFRVHHDRRTITKRRFKAYAPCWRTGY